MADKVRSILAADFGSVYTRAVLIDLVDGEYRLIARGEGRTTDGFPVFDLEVGFNRIVRDLANDIGRRLADQAGRVVTPETAERTGVDLFAVSASIGRPLRAVVIGLMPAISIQSAIRATTGSYIDVRAVIGLDDGRSEEDKLNAILLNYPDVILLTGGTDGGASAAILHNAEMAYLAVSLIERGRRPTVIYSGNQKIADRIYELFEPLTTVFIAKNVRPSLEEERLQAARFQLGRAFDQYKETHQKSFVAISEASQTGILSTAQGQSVVVEYLSKAEGANVAILDVGSSALSLAVVENGNVQSTIRTDLGLGHSAPQTLATLGIAAIRGWLPMYISEGALRNYALNKSLRPGSIPMNLRELYIEHAYLRAGGRFALQSINSEWVRRPLSLDRIITCGSALTRTGSPGYDALLALDCLQPVGVTVLESDPFGMVPAMGTIAGYAPEAVVQMLDGDNLTRLGIAFSPTGQPRKDKPAMKITIQGETSSKVEMTVLGGHIDTYPLPYGEYAKVTVRCSGGLKINGKRSMTVTVGGGALGLIFDGRGRPLSVAESPEGRAEQLPLWVHEITGDAQQTVPENWLDPAHAIDTAADGLTVTAESESESDSEANGRKRGRRGKKKQKKDEIESRLDDLLGERD